MYSKVTINGNTFLDYTDTDNDIMQYLTSTPLQYIVKPSDIGRPDSISMRMYGKYEYYRYILLYNELYDPFNSLEVGMNIRIPLLEDINRYINSKKLVDKWK